MAEIKSPDEPTFPLKRKPGINGEDSHGHQNKAHKLETSDEAKHLDASLISSDNVDVLSGNCSSVTEKKVEKADSDVVAEDGADDGGNIDHGGADKDGGADEDDDGEESNGDVVVDRKGKGIMIADKGKGKLIEEDDEEEEDSENDDDDSSDDGVVSDGDSDLSDDPLAEVDLNNILPSRTRGRTIHPGEYIANDLGNDEDDDSDDSDM